MKGPYFDRVLQQRLPDMLAPNKVLLIYGARRVGKTELLKKYLSTQHPTHISG
jgi:uncharacterized protein